MAENEKNELPQRKRKLPIHIKLEEPIDCGNDQQMTEIVIARKPRGSDWADFNVQNSTVGDFLKVGARLANLPLPIVKKMDSKATFELVEVVSSFLEQE